MARIVGFIKLLRRGEALAVFDNVDNIFKAGNLL
jgi:hypothetical protein